jgi:hypothetical protein
MIDLIQGFLGVFGAVSSYGKGLHSYMVFEHICYVGSEFHFHVQYETSKKLH